ncbi:hypothetical protein EI94DRAFT_1703322 [Lactarius quietus]|nr:hypothetical protein EI94DRAFT_1703322 [Lactarius quietus]
MQGNPTKRPWTTGPVCSHPMSLVIPSEDCESYPFSREDVEPKNQQHRDNGIGKGKDKQVQAKLECMTTIILLPNFKVEAAISMLLRWTMMDDDSTIDVAVRLSTKFSESLEIERPSWAVSGSSQPMKHASQSSSASFNDPIPRVKTEPGLDTAVPTARLPFVPTQTPSVNSVSSPQSEWPVDTKLVYPSGANKLMLTSQCPIVRAVIQEAIENLQAALLFNNTFPDVCFTIGLIKDCLLNAANHLKPGATDVLNRLEHNQLYLLKITPLPHARICLIHSKVKEWHNTITMASFLALGPPLDIIEYVRIQLSKYMYTFPGAPLVNATAGFVMRTWPYHNKRIILVIQDMYFSGGNRSFHEKFGYLFPTFETHDGDMIELYTTIYKWHTREQQITEFSANAYLNVYHGHENRPGVYHLMMADIYKLACMHKQLGNETNSSVPIADLDLDNLEG